MKTKLFLLLGAAVAVCSLSSCEIYGYPGTYGYAPRAPYYDSSYSSRPLMSYNSYVGGYSRPYYGYSSYSRPYSSFGRYGYGGGHSCAPLVSRSCYSSFGSGFGGSPFGHRSFGGPSFGGGGHHHCR